ncbi:MAG: CMP-N-acetylneuraminic acid synthetase [Minisyncoccia bacterium]
MKKAKFKGHSDQRVTALLTGRGGSTLRDKNVILVLGKPLLSYPAKAAYGSNLIHDYYVSSDSIKILNSAKAIGYFPIKRPPAFSKPDSQHEDVIRHTLSHLKKLEKVPDIIVVLLANSVTIKTKWIDDCIEAIIKDPSLTAVVPVYQDSDHHPFRSKKINKSGLLEPFFDFKGKIVSTNRQDLEPSYFLCHNFWVLRTSNFESSTGQQPWKFMGNKIKPYVMKEETFDVHGMADINRSEKWLKANKKHG